MSRHAAGDAPDPQLTQELTRRLTLAAERRWGTNRAVALADAIRGAAATLAQVAAVELELDDDEPDFVR